MRAPAARVRTTPWETTGVATAPLTSMGRIPSAWSTAAASRAKRSPRNRRSWATNTGRDTADSRSHRATPRTNAWARSKVKSSARTPRQPLVPKRIGRSVRANPIRPGPLLAGRRGRRSRFAPAPELGRPEPVPQALGHVLRHKVVDIPAEADEFFQAGGAHVEELLTGH